MRQGFFLVALRSMIQLGTLAVFVPLVAWQATARAGNTIETIPTSGVTVCVRIFESRSLRPPKDEGLVAVWLVPAEGATRRILDAQAPRYRMIERHKMFEPRLLVVPVGSIVEFSNLDPWFHGAFSLSSSKRFDLGLYRTGISKAVKFDNPGASYVFCNIHPEMAAVVLAVDSRYFGVSDARGYVFIRNVPAGKYVIHSWHEGDTRPIPKALGDRVVVGDAKHGQQPISVVIAQTAPEEETGIHEGEFR